MAKWVYMFTEGNANMRNLLGGKGANLAEMTNLGLPVPQGFTITTEACTQYYEDGRQINDEIMAQIMEAITKMEGVTGKKFGDKENPLLVSVRSGARASMPGMMDTILNLGLNEEVVNTLAEKSNNPRWAWDCYRRFIQMYSDVVMEVGKKYFEELIDKMKEEKGVKLGIENCLMDGTWEHATCNIGFNPKAWEVMFEEVKNDNFGLEWEPTHQMVQLIDPVTELRKWCKKIVHIHGKDATIDWDAVRHSGISGAVPFVWHRMPGFGDTNWRDIISILRSNGYEDDICIEGYHDPVYSGELEMTGQLHALNYLKWCRGGEFTQTPWAK